MWHSHVSKPHCSTEQNTLGGGERGGVIRREGTVPQPQPRISGQKDPPPEWPQSQRGAKGQPWGGGGGAARSWPYSPIRDQRKLSPPPKPHRSGGGPQTLHPPGGVSLRSQAQTRGVLWGGGGGGLQGLLWESGRAPADPRDHPRPPQPLTPVTPTPIPAFPHPRSSGPFGAFRKASAPNERREVGERGGYKTRLPPPPPTFTPSPGSPPVPPRPPPDPSRPHRPGRGLQRAPAPTAPGAAVPTLKRRLRCDGGGPDPAGQRPSPGNGGGGGKGGNGTSNRTENRNRKASKPGPGTARPGRDTKRTPGPRFGFRHRDRPHRRPPPPNTLPRPPHGAPGGGGAAPPQRAGRPRGRRRRRGDFSLPGS